jgi:NAD+ kinase
MIIALFPNVKLKNAHSIAIGIREFLTHRDVKVVAEDEEAAHIGAEALSSVDPKKIDFAISMGGDGTILRLIHNHPEIEAPIVGVNLGHLGFMADVPLSEIYPSLQDLMNGAYKVEQRVMLAGEAVNGEKAVAVNEMVVHRAKNPSLIELALHIDGNYLNTFEADGVIIATPSGSTAYSLAAGGPILTPELEAFVITPISPHTISNRPIVVLPDQEIQIQYISEQDPVEVSFDGISYFSMKSGDVFRLSRATRSFKLISLSRFDYFSTLRTKLGWVGKLRQ